MLKTYIPEIKERKSLIKGIIKQFEKETIFKHILDVNTSLILIKDERKELTQLRKYKDSPFPYLSNLDCFNNSVGGSSDWCSDS